MVDLRYDSAKNLEKVNFVTRETKESILLRRVVQGDRRAFWEIWALYQDYLYHRSLVWMAGNRDDAQEVMSLASLKAWQKLPEHAHKITNLKGWLNRFTHNLCIDIHRQRKHQAIGVDNVEDVPLNNQEIASATNPESKLVQKELYVYIRYWIDDLAPRLRDPLILSYYQGMSHADIGQQLSISPDNVAKRLQFGKQILQKHLNQYLAGLNTTKVSETQLQHLEQKDFSASINVDDQIEEINYRMTISCLETLPPVWLNFQNPQGWT